MLRAALLVQLTLLSRGAYYIVETYDSEVDKNHGVSDKRTHESHFGKNYDQSNKSETGSDYEEEESYEYEYKDEESFRSGGLDAEVREASACVIVSFLLLANEGRGWRGHLKHLILRADASQGGKVKVPILSVFQECNCGKMDLESVGEATRIVGGKEAKKDNHPWQAVSFNSESFTSWVSGFF